MQIRPIVFVLLVFQVIFAMSVSVYAQTDVNEVDLTGLLATSEVSLTSNHTVESVYTSEPAIAAYMAVGTSLIAKMYSNWLRESGAVDQETIEWLKAFNTEKDKLQSLYPNLKALEIEYLVVQKMNGKNHSPQALSSCQSCGNDHGAHSHHHGHSHDHSHAHSESTEKPGGESLRYEEALNGWLKVMHELGALDPEIRDSVTNLTEPGFTDLEQGSRRASWSDMLMGQVESQIEGQLDQLQDARILLEELRADFGETPLVKLRRLRALFFQINRKHVKSFLMGGVAMLVRSGKYIVWDGLLKPVVETVTGPRRTLVPLLARSRISRGERGRVSSAVVGTLGGAMFFAYEFVLHGILQIHVACNHSLQFALAMASAGVIYDVAKQPFLISRLLPDHFNLLDRARLGLSIALGRWQMARWKKNFQVTSGEETFEISYKKFMDTIGGQLASRGKLVELSLNSPLWRKVASQVVEGRIGSHEVDLAASESHLTRDTELPSYRDVEMLFSEDLDSRQKRRLISELLAGFQIYGESIHHSLIQASLLNRFNRSDLKLAQSALGRVKKNTSLLEELLLILSVIDSSKVEPVFQGPEVVNQELSALLENLSELRELALEMNRSALAAAPFVTEPSKSFLKKLIELPKTLLTNKSSEFTARLRESITKVETDTVRLRKARVHGFSPMRCSSAAIQK